MHNSSSSSRHVWADRLFMGAGLLSVAMALGLSLGAPPPGAAGGTWWIALVVWAILLTLSGSLVFEIAGGYLSLQNLLAVTGVLIFGMAPALWIVILSIIGSEIILTRWAERLHAPRRTWRRTLSVTATNVSFQVLSLLVGWLAFRAIGGRVPMREFSTSASLSPIVLFLGYFITNNLLFSLNLKIEEGEPIHRTLWRDWQMVALFDLLPLPLSIVIAHVYVKLGLWSFIGLSFYLLGGMVLIHVLNQARTATERRVTDLSILNEIGRALSSALNLDELLETVHNQVRRIFDTTNFFIVTYEQGSDEWVSAFRLEHGERQPVARRKLGAGLTGYIIRNRTPLLFRTGAEVDAFLAQQGITRVGEPSRSWMGVPLIAADEVVGAMAIQSYTQEHLYTPQDLDLFSTIAAQVAIAIRNARLYAETRRRADEATSLFNIGVLLASTLDMDEILMAIYREASQVMDTTGFSVALYDEASQQVHFELAIDQGERLEHFSRPISETPLNAWIIHNQQAIFVRDPERDVFPIQEMVTVGREWLPRSFVGIPLIYKGRAIGAITVQSERPFAFDQHQKQVLESIAHLAAPALENARLNSRTQ